MCRIGMPKLRDSVNVSMFRVSGAGHPSCSVAATYILKEGILSYVWIPNASGICFVRRI